MLTIPQHIKKILLIKPRGIGDIVLSTIVVDNLINYFPSAKIDYLTEPFAKPAIDNIPQINNVLTFERNEFIFKIIKEIRRQKYDIVFDLWTNPKTAQITFLSGAKYRVGYSYRGRKYAYNIKATSSRGNHHSAEHNLELLESLNIPIISKKILFNLDNEKFVEAKLFVKNNFDPKKNIIGILPSGSWKSKRVDTNKWIEICHAALKKYSVKYFVIWGPGDEADSMIIKNELRENVVLAPKTDLKLMSAMIKCCDFILSNDSGPMHIAAALNVPILGIFGPTNPYTHRPYSQNSGFIHKSDLHCITCDKLECPFNHECILNLSTDDILIEIERLAGNILIKN